MATINMERKARWLILEPGDKKGIDDGPEHMVPEATAEEQWVLIGKWYYYLRTNGISIDLYRTWQKPGQPALTEILDPGYHAISEDDLRHAVQYETCGESEPGCYRISPHIERKLRILFE